MVLLTNATRSHKSCYMTPMWPNLEQLSKASFLIGSLCVAALSLFASGLLFGLFSLDLTRAASVAIPGAARSGCSSGWPYAAGTGSAAARFRRRTPRRGCPTSPGCFSSRPPLLLPSALRLQSRDERLGKKPDWTIRRCERLQFTSVSRAVSWSCHLDTSHKCYDFTHCVLTLAVRRVAGRALITSFSYIPPRYDSPHSAYWPCSWESELSLSATAYEYVI